eukprot:COSAG02_NODE_763_length_17431_cov_18.031502_1_plen_154_part_00
MGSGRVLYLPTSARGRCWPFRHSRTGAEPLKATDWRRARTWQPRNRASSCLRGTALNNDCYMCSEDGDSCRRHTRRVACGLLQKLWCTAGWRSRQCTQARVSAVTHCLHAARRYVDRVGPRAPRGAGGVPPRATFDLKWFSLMKYIQVPVPAP